MHIVASEFRLFNEEPMENKYREGLTLGIREIRRLDEDRILSIKPEQFARELVDKYGIAIPKMHVDQMEITHTFEDHDGPLETGGRTSIIVTFGVPFEGPEQALKLDPGEGRMWTKKGRVHDGHFEFFEKMCEATQERIDAIADAFKKSFERRFHDVENKQEYFNERMRSIFQETLDQRMDRLKTTKKAIASSSVRVRPRKSRGRTVASLEGKRRAIKPDVKSGTTMGATRKPEYMLNNDDFIMLLDTIFLFGQGLERHPSTHHKKGEEDIRDLLLILMDALFEPETTAETFNKRGKTDILMRHKDSVLFVVECLVWDGREYLHKKIDQIMGYLTWRDSKAALIVFSRKKHFSEVMKKIEEAIQDHPCYHSKTADTGPGRSIHNFQSSEGKPCKIHVGILCFNLFLDEKR